ncbi:sporulation protein YhbH [Brevibacillus sp. NRS-1366]|uniref:sporulation protein YhbH n=1 Tax=Brevibacillus sp. NRS-1366 TaxID=3233899 RepID=UPI003D23C33C
MSTHDFSFILSRDDWSLHRKGQLDQERHKQKVKEAIKQNLADLVSEEAIIMSDGEKKIRVPIRSMEQYRFRYSYEKQEQVGQGKGGSKPGDMVGRDGQPQAGPGSDSGAGDAPGEEMYEAEVSIDELAELIFEDLSLPNMRPKEMVQITEQDVHFNDVRKQGIMGNLDKRRTLLEALKRRSLRGEHGHVQFTQEDLRFKTWNEVEKPVTNAVIFAMLDTSGSMGTFEKYIARCFFFWMTRFLRTRYSQVEIVFLAHHTEAKEVTEHQFFTKAQSGGTLCSSVYKLALELIEKRYSPNRYNLYAFHFSDGDNLTSDNPLTLQYVRQLVAICNAVGYGEINPHNRISTMMEVMKQVADERFVYSTIKSKQDVYPTVKSFFRETLEGVG